MNPAECLDLNGLQDQHREASRTQMPDHTALIAAGRLDTDATDAGFDQPGRQYTPSGQGVGDLPMSRSAVNCNVELAFGRIDSCCRRASLRHPRRPRLVKRT